MSETRHCVKSGEAFLVAGEDLEFYEKISPRVAGKTLLVPPPTRCPEIRQMRRLAWRNSHHLYKRKCDLTGASIISAYPENSNYKIYSSDAWWGDGWDPLESGIEFDFSRPFFEQFRELMLQTPRLALMNRDSENSEYCNYAGKNKNCYLANHGSWYSEDCMYGEAYLRCRDCVDSSYLRECELCYEVIGGENLYNCGYLVDCYNSNDCYFSLNLRGCHNCFFSSNLRNKSYYIWNKPASKEEFEALRTTLRSHQALAKMKADFCKLWSETTHPEFHQIHCEASSGEYLAYCKNVTESFLALHVEDGKYLLHCDEAKDLFDCCHTGYGMSELFYETANAGIGGQRALFSQGNWSSSDVYYCDTIMSCSHCFGCVSLKHKKYCVLNREYKKADYEDLVAKIVTHMQNTGEWGEFFPEELAPFPFNESNAIDFWPREKPEALKLGYSWRDQVRSATTAEVSKLPDSIDKLGEDIISRTLACEKSEQAYRILKPELQFYQKFGVAAPRRAAEVRRLERNTLRNPPRLYERNCPTCNNKMTTTFSPQRTEKVVCERCYLKDSVLS